MVKKISILIVEDEIIISHGIKISLDNLGYEVVATANSAKEAIELASHYHPSLVLMDIMLATKDDGIWAAGQIGSQLNIPVVFLTAYFDEATLDKAKSVNPFGYVTKPFQDKDLHIAIEMAIYKHQNFDTMNKLLHFIPTNISIDQSLKGLTIREREVCCLIKGGFSDQEIADNLFISLHTVKSHIKNILRKFNAKSKLKLVALLNNLTQENLPTDQTT